MTVTDREQRDSGLRPQLLNPLTEDEAEAYLNDDRWCVQEKYDGRRILMRKSGTELVAVNRDGLCVGFPEAFATLASVKGNFVIDGESVGDVFYAFDLLENDEGDMRPVPYRARLAALQARFGRLEKASLLPRRSMARPSGGSWNRSGRRQGGIVFRTERIVDGGTASQRWDSLKMQVLGDVLVCCGEVNARRSVEVALGGRSVGNVSIPPNQDIPRLGRWWKSATCMSRRLADRSTSPCI